MPVINKPKKVKVKTLLILLREIEKNYLENDQEDTVYSSGIGTLREVETQVLSIDEQEWNQDHEAVWSATDYACDVFAEGDPGETTAASLFAAIETALGEL